MPRHLQEMCFGFANTAGILDSPRVAESAASISEDTSPNRPMVVPPTLAGFSGSAGAAGDLGTADPFADISYPRSQINRRPGRICLVNHDGLGMVQFVRSSEPTERDIL